jgi:ankyrin repeat protein
VINLLEHGARIIERSNGGKTSLLYAAVYGKLDVLKYVLSSEGVASITETDVEENTAILLVAGVRCNSEMVQWLLEYGGAHMIDTDNEGRSVWTELCQQDLPHMLKSAYTKRNGELVPNEDVVKLTATLRVMVLHGGPQSR